MGECKHVLVLQGLVIEEAKYKVAKNIRWSEKMLGSWLLITKPFNGFVVVVLFQLWFDFMSIRND